MVQAYKLRTKNIVYEADPKGMRQLGVSKVASKAAGQGASRVVSAANSRDPKGQYTATGVGTWAGRDNEPRNATVVEGYWYPGANTAALRQAIRDAAQGFK